MSARRAGWLCVASEGEDGIKSLSGAPPSSPHISQPLALSCSLLSHHIWTLSTAFFFFFKSSKSLFLPIHTCPPVFHAFFSPLHFSFFLFLYSSLSLPCTLSPLLPPRLLAVRRLGMRCVPEQSGLCYPTRRVGVKHRQWRSLPGRWHRTGANGYGECSLYSLLPPTHGTCSLRTTSHLRE